MSITKKNTLPRAYKVQYVFSHEVSSFETIYDLYAAISLKTQKVFKDFYCSPGSIDFSEKTGKQAAGIFYSTALKLFFPGMDPITEARLVQLDHGKIIFKVFFDDATVRFVGSLDYPMRVISEVSTVSDKTGILISASHQSPEKSRFLVPIESILPPPLL